MARHRRYTRALRSARGRRRVFPRRRRARRKARGVRFRSAFEPRRDSSRFPARAITPRELVRRVPSANASRTPGPPGDRRGDREHCARRPLGARVRFGTFADAPRRTRGRRTRPRIRGAISGVLVFVIERISIVILVLIVVAGELRAARAGGRRGRGGRGGRGGRAAPRTARVPERPRDARPVPTSPAPTGTTAPGLGPRVGPSASAAGARLPAQTVSRVRFSRRTLPPRRRRAVAAEHDQATPVAGSSRRRGARRRPARRTRRRRRRGRRGGTPGRRRSGSHVGHGDRGPEGTSRSRRGRGERDVVGRPVFRRRARRAEGAGRARESPAWAPPAVQPAAPRPPRSAARKASVTLDRLSTASVGEPHRLGAGVAAETPGGPSRRRRRGSTSAWAATANRRGRTGSSAIFVGAAPAAYPQIARRERAGAEHARAWLRRPGSFQSASAAAARASRRRDDDDADALRFT